MVKKIRRKVKKIAMMASLVKMELEDLVEENKENQKKMSEDFQDEFEFLNWRKNKIKKESKETPPPEQKPVPSEEQVDKYEAPKELKKVYRAIALKSHPDRINDEELNEIFREAVEAMETENWMKLVELAGEAGVDIGFISDETCELIEQSIARNTKEIQSMKNSFSYMWSKQKTDFDKDKFKKLFYLQNKINIEEFNEWVSHHKGS